MAQFFRKFFFYLAFVAGSLIFAQRSAAQNPCYVRLEDASGINTDAYQTELEAVACALRASFPDSFQNQFKVFDFGFYLHQETYSGGYPEAFAQKIQQVGTMSPYYLLFGKQTDATGVYTRFWVEIKLPETGKFSCMTELQREVYEKKVEKKVNDAYIKQGNSYDVYGKAEIDGMNEFIAIIEEIKNCCVVNLKNGMPGCDGCGIENIKTYFTLLDFDRYKISSEPAPLISFTSTNIQDVSGVRVKCQGSVNYVNSYISSLVDNINQKLDLKVLVTSDIRMCGNSLGDYGNYIAQTEFGAWINLGNHEQNDSSYFYINVIWNENKKKIAQNKIQGDAFASEIACQILALLNVADSPCEGQEPPPMVVYPFCQQNSTVNNNPHDIAWFIERVKEEENKYPPLIRKNTKLMLSIIRKIFYNTPAWNQIIIPKTEGIKAPYEASIIPYPGFPKVWPNPSFYVDMNVITSSAEFRFVDIESRPVANGQSPGIYCDDIKCSNFNQEVMATGCNGAQSLIDIGHVFAGLDALNNLDMVEYKILNFIKLPIKISNNHGPATWMGDIGSVISTTLYEQDKASCEVHTRITLSDSKIQEIVNSFASGADMLGNIDAYVIAKNYPVGATENGMLVSDILTHYYLGGGQQSLQKYRYSTFAQEIGLVWDGQNFTNLNQKMPSFVKDVLSFAVLFTAASVKNYSFSELPAADFALARLYLSDEKAKEHLNIFFNNLKLQILSQ